MYLFLYPTLLNLEIHGFTFIHSKANLINPEFEMKGKLIDDKMLRTYVKELGCKHPISWA
jgi:hypothetical protein